MRGSGRTTRMLADAAKAKAEGKRVIVLVADHQQLKYCVKIEESLWSDFLTPAAIGLRLKGDRESILFVDHYVFESVKMYYEDFLAIHMRLRTRTRSMADITYVEGDATKVAHRPAFLVHIVNDAHKWGSGFVLAVSKRWKKPEQVYKWNRDLTLGQNQYVDVDEGLTVVNMIAQRGVNRKVRAVSYDALDLCLQEVYQLAEEGGQSVHMPLIGADRGGGDWRVIRGIILSNLTVPTFVYLLPGSRPARGGSSLLTPESVSPTSVA